MCLVSLMGGGRKAGCPPAVGGVSRELGTLGRLSPPSQEGKGGGKAEREDGERFVANGTQMHPPWDLGFQTDPVPSFVKVMRW